MGKVPATNEEWLAHVTRCERNARLAGLREAAEILADALNRESAHRAIRARISELEKE